MPDGSLRTFDIDRRCCPITGAWVRITQARPLGTLPRQDDLQQVVQQSRTNCPFCPDSVLKSTPGFASQHGLPPRLVHGQSVIFPNISPYGPNSAVVLFSGDHHIGLGAFIPDLIRDCLINIRNYIKKLHFEPSYLTITQNMLPSSGAALVHPHMQVNLDPMPMNYHALMLESVNKWAVESNEKGSLISVLADEERLSARHVLSRDSWTLAAAFAPLAQEEFWILGNRPCTFGELSPPELQALAELISATWGYWASRGFNSAGLALFSAQGRDCHNPFVRVFLRSSWSPWYRNDQSAYEVGALEPARDVLPENLAADLRRHLTVTAAARQQHHV